MLYRAGNPPSHSRENAASSRLRHFAETNASNLSELRAGEESSSFHAFASYLMELNPRRSFGAPSTHFTGGTLRRSAENLYLRFVTALPSSSCVYKLTCGAFKFRAPLARVNELPGRVCPKSSAGTYVPTPTTGSLAFDRHFRS